MSRIYTTSDVGRPRFSNAWTDGEGQTFSAVLVGAGHITFSSAEDAEALSAACLEAAEAYRRQQAAHLAAKGDGDE